VVTNLNVDEIKKSGSLELLAKQLVEGFITGLHKSPYHGFSVEFAEHRLYNEGQSTRHIDWKVFARTDRLYTKQYEEETNLRCLILIDCSPSMFYPAETRAKFRFSVYSAAALAYLLHKQRDAVGLCLFASQIDEYSPMRSTTAHLNKLFGMLERALELGGKKREPTRIADVLHEVAEKTHRRSLIVLFSDMFDGSEDPAELFKALQHLKHNKHEVLLFHVSDHDTELAFNFPERPYEFIDLENGEKLKLNPAEIRDRYTAQLGAFHRELKMKCNQLKIDFVSANARSDYFEVLQAYLIKRSKMK
jgi:uncharacterized protein (DUF58 family)